MSFVSRVEEMLLLAIWKLGDDAYGAAIFHQVEQDTGSAWLSGSVYGALTRLKKNGYVRTTGTEKSPGQTGRPRIYYTLTEIGMNKLIAIQKVNHSLWNGVPNLEHSK